MYCNLTEDCKVVQQSVNQYNEVVKQNGHLQQELRFKNKKLLEYKTVVVALVEYFHILGEFWSDDLKRHIEEFLMVENINYANNNGRNKPNDRPQG